MLDDEQVDRRAGIGIERPDPVIGHAGVLEPVGHVGAADASGGQRGLTIGQELEIDIPEPGDVTAIGVAVVDHDHGRHGQAVGRHGQHAEHLVEADRILDQCQGDRAAGDSIRSMRPKADLNSAIALWTTVRLHAERGRDGRGGEDVVGVVHARHAGAIDPDRRPGRPS